ncbi:MAG: AbrB/MazE/SpoVT family DNA-binding domain-containing protein [Clostridia bacterium]|nr:AbrB/MazE/SpoVT family DNA-binding domain-containing protein [Clostridia bacterium]
MKATGIVRRIDDLGRVVIPKEIRRTMRIREGDPLEIYTDREGEVIFKKYSPIGELSDFSQDYCESLNKASGVKCFVCDRDTFVAAAGVPKKEFLEKKLPEKLEERLGTRSVFAARGGEATELFGGYCLVALFPIVSEGDLRGAVGFLSEKAVEPTLSELSLGKTAACFLAKRLEE